MKKFIVLLIVLAITASGFGAITARKHNDSGLGSWDYTVSTSTIYSDWAGNGIRAGGPYPLGDPTYADCVSLDGISSGVYHHDYDGVVWNNTSGSFSAWVSPSWDGENQGGNHPNGTYQDVLTADGAQQLYPVTQGVNLFFFDNNYGPTPGYQLMACYTDAGGSYIRENYAVGNTMDWTAESWHHVQVSWSPTEVVVGLDGVIFGAWATDAGGLNWANGGYIWFMNTGGGPTNMWSGWGDDVIVTDSGDEGLTGHGFSDGDAYVLPTGPGTIGTPEPATIALLGLGALALLRKRS